MLKIDIFQTVQFCILKQFFCQTIQFCLSTHFSFLRHLDRTLLNTTTPGLRGRGTDGNEGVLHIPHMSGITGSSPSESLALYPGRSLGESYPSAEKQSVYSTASTNLGEDYIYIYIIYIYIYIYIYIELTEIASRNSPTKVSPQWIIKESWTVEVKL